MERLDERCADEAEVLGGPAFEVRGRQPGGFFRSETIYTFNGPDAAKAQYEAAYPDHTDISVKRVAGGVR